MNEEEKAYGKAAALLEAKNCRVQRPPAMNEEEKVYGKAAALLDSKKLSYAKVKTSAA